MFESSALEQVFDKTSTGKVRMTASSKSIEMKVLLLLSLVGLITVASSDTILPPEISKCCTDDTAPECKQIDAALGHEGHLYTFFGAYYAKLRVNSKGLPEALEGYPKKITGTEKGSFGTTIKVDKKTPLESAFSDNCVSLIFERVNYCFEITAAADGETIKFLSSKPFFGKNKDTRAVMATKFKSQPFPWLWFWEMTGGKCTSKIREGNAIIGTDTEVPVELIPRAVAGFLVGDTFKGFVFLRDSGLVYPFTLKEKETKLTPGAERIKASQFIGCSRVPKSTDSTTDSTADSMASTTPKATGASEVTSSRTDESGIPQMFYIVSGAILGVIALGFIVLGCFWLLTRRGRDKGGEGVEVRGGGSGRGGGGGGRAAGQERGENESKDQSDDELRDRRGD